MSRPLSALLSTKEGGGVSVKTNECPINCEPIVVYSIQIFYEFSLSHGWEFRARNFFTGRKPHTWCTELHGIEKRSIPLTKKIEFDLDWSETL